MSHLGRRLSALIDSELTGAERDRVLAHLASCGQCQQEAVAIRALKRRLHDLGEATAEAELPQHVIDLAAAAGRQAGPARPPAAGAPPGRAPDEREHPARRRAGAIAVGAFSLLAAGFAAAAFLAGGNGGQPGPDVTPSVDVFMVQHGVSDGSVPVPGRGSPGGPSSAPHGERPSAKP